MTRPRQARRPQTAAPAPNDPTINVYSGSAAPAAPHLDPAAVRSAIVQIADYQPHPRNYNGHPARQIEAIAASLRKFGQPRPVAVWRGYYLAGHGVVAAAKSIGWTTIRADILPDDYPEHLALAYVAADNELARLSDPDEAALAAILQESREQDPELLGAMGYTAAEFAELLARVEATRKAATTGDPEPQIERAEELAEAWATAAGQLWALGSHRLLCGDCTEAENWRRLMQGEIADLLWTDPPYGVDYSAKNARMNLFDKGNRVQTPIIDDNLSRDDLAALWSTSLGQAAQHSRPGAACYICAAQGDLFDACAGAVRRAGWGIHRQLVWVKNNRVLSFSDYPYQHEPIIYGWKTGAGHTWNDATTATTVIDDDPSLNQMDKRQLIDFINDLRNAMRGTVIRVSKPASSELHPTTKPTKLIRLTAINNTAPGDLWIDPFAGSGSTLIAAEQTGRRCNAMELTPQYCAVILQRYVDATGATPRLLEPAP